MDQGRRRDSPKQGQKAGSAKGPRCPECKQALPADLPARAPFRPFCSERCKLIDLGRWLGGDHKIPGEPAWVVDDDEGN